MKNVFKKVLTLVLAALMIVAAVSLVSCSSFKTADDIKNAGKLVLYTEAGFAPYEFVYNNEIVGVDISIMKEVAKELGVELEIIDVNFDTIIGAIQAGKADVGAAGITITDSRKDSVDFSHPYSFTEQYVIVPAATDIPVLEDLKGKTIGVQQGTTSDLMVEGYINDGTLAGSEIKGYNTPALAAAAIDKLYAVVTDKLTAEIIIAGSNGSLKCAKLVKADGTDAQKAEEYGIAVAKGNETLLAAINKVVDKLMADGTIDKWTSEYNALAKTIED